MITGFNHTSFTVAEIGKSVEFWRDAMGFELASLSPRNGDWQERITGVPGAELMVAHLYGHGHHMEFIQYTSGAENASAPPPSRHCAAHVCFEVKDILSVRERLFSAGATPQGEIVEVRNGPVEGCRACYIRDPNGIIVELLEPLGA